MTDAQETVHQLHLNLLLERDAELESFDQFMKVAPVKERVQRGQCWYPVQVIKTGYGLGDYPYITVERTATDYHHFHIGGAVSVFSNHPEYQNESVKGSIHYVDRNTMKVVLYQNETPDWLDEGKIGIDKAPDIRTFQVMEKAIHLVLNAERNRLAELRESFYGDRRITFEKHHHKVELPYLNDSQNKAVNQTCMADDITIIHGPPGTGKTTTLVAAIAQLVKTEKRVLVVAPSNTAVDLLAERTAAKKMRVLRIGNLSKIDENLYQHTPDYQLKHHPEANVLKQLKRRAKDMRKMAGKHKRSFGPEERQQRKLLYREAREMGKEAIALEDSMVGELVRNAQVICCTPVGSYSKWLEGQRFQTVVIDEAGQALEPACWIPILKAEKVVLAGDPLQLPPTVKSREAAKAGLTVTLLEKSVARLPEVCLLNIQYRMHTAIMGFSNQEFYNNELQAAAHVAGHTVTANNSRPLEFLDTAGCGFDEKREHENSSTSNPGEAELLFKHLEELTTSLEDAPSIGIISPYRAQVELLQNSAKERQLENVTINTVDGFQGQEKDVIYLSLVRSNENGEIGFLSDFRRMNVAMTRARKKLVVIGDSATLGAHGFYQRFLDYVEQQEAYRSAWEYA